MAFRYRFFEHELPDVLVAVGEPHGAAPLAEFTRRLGATLAELDDTHMLDDFTPLVRGRRSVIERWDAVRGLAR